MKSIEELKQILPHAKETLKVSQTFEAIVKERERTKRPRLLFLEECLLSIKEQIEAKTLEGEYMLIYSMPQMDKELDSVATWMELQSLLHDAGYSAEIYPQKNEITISWKKRC